CWSRPSPAASASWPPTTTRSAGATASSRTATRCCCWAVHSPADPVHGTARCAGAGASVEADEYNSHFGWASRRRPPPHRKESPMRPFHAARAACAAIMALSLMAACGRQDAPDAAPPGTDAADPREVNLYTTREPGLIQPLLDAFTASSGIEVNPVFVRDGLLERVRAEGERSPADVLMTVDTGNLLDLVDDGQTQPVESQVLADAVPAHLRGQDGQWFALSLRDRILYADKDLALESFTYEELADPKWKGRVCIRSGQHPYNTSL